MAVELSVVTITYKDPEGLKRTAESLEPLLGSKVEWEHVVVDSSPDANREVLAALGEKRWPLAHVEAPARGIYPAQNEGIAAARGKFVWLLNGGDLMKSPGALLAALKAFERDPQLDLVCSAAELTRDGKFLYLARAPRNWARGLAGFNRVCHQALLYRRSALERVGGFDESYKLASDYEHHFRCYLAGLKLGTQKGVLVSYDMSGRSNDVRPVLREFRKVQRAVGPKLPKWFRLANEALLPAEQARVTTLKALAASPLAGALKPLWLAYKRRR